MRRGRLMVAVLALTGGVVALSQAPIGASANGGHHGALRGTPGTPHAHNGTPCPKHGAPGVWKAHGTPGPHHGHH